MPPRSLKQSPIGRRVLGARGGFTLVELLVVMAIVGLLMALLMVAVGQAREAGRRAQCQNNLRQIALAATAYHGARGHFPVGCTEWRSAAKPQNRQLSWCVWLLPFLEQQPLFDRLDTKKAFDAPENAAAAAQPIATLICPTSRREGAIVAGRGACDYGGNYGERLISPNDPPKGTMLYEKPVKLKEIIDGASKTILIGEDSQSPDGEWINGRNVFDQAYTINEYIPTPPGVQPENDIRSYHPGGAGVALCDGSVQFLSEMLDKRTLAALLTRARRDTVGSY